MVQVRPARARCRHRLLLWFELLLAAASAPSPTPPRQALLIARGDKGMEAALRLSAPSAEEARAELQRLAHLRLLWQQRCWPVPPDTGWALLERGEVAAIATWEGTPQRPGERSEAEQSLCFGADMGGRALLERHWPEANGDGPGGQAGLAELAHTLLDPLRARRA